LTGASTGSANPLVNEGAHDNGVVLRKTEIGLR